MGSEVHCQQCGMTQVLGKEYHTKMNDAGLDSKYDRGNPKEVEIRLKVTGRF